MLAFSTSAGFSSFINEIDSFGTQAARRAANSNGSYRARVPRIYTLLLFFTHGGNTWKGKRLDLFGIGYVEDEIVTGIRFYRKSLKE